MNTNKPTSLFDRVYSMKAGTVFQVGNGAPWIRTRQGVSDLLPLTEYFKAASIPPFWKNYPLAEYPVTVLYEGDNLS